MASKDVLDRIGLKSAEEFVIKTRDSGSDNKHDDAYDALIYGIDEIMRSRNRVKGVSQIVSEQTSEDDIIGNGESEESSS